MFSNSTPLTALTTRPMTEPRPEPVTITCADGMIQEARICLTKELTPRRCGEDVIRDCRMRDAVMEAVR